ncbi:hypothetical protein V6Z12_D01G220200 [Gossypium hirsutum]
MMAAVAWRSLLPVIMISIFMVYEDWVSFPSCKLLPSTTYSPDKHVENVDDSLEDLKVMMVANLLLLGSEAGFVNLYFRDYYMSKFFKKSFQSLNPDMLLVLGDVSAKGDVGECSGLCANSVTWIARNFPGLDSSGCGAFEISNISFVSLNAVALLCGNNKLRFDVEKVIERESVGLQMEIEGMDETNNGFGMFSEMSNDFRWRVNAMKSGSGPVLLLHFPLYRSGKTHIWEGSTFKSIIDPSGKVPASAQREGFSGTGPYDLSQTVPPNATEYIFHALKPRIIFSAHTQEFSDHTHPDGTREVTIPAMTWKVRDDPGFIVATFQRNKSAEDPN